MQSYYNIIDYVPYGVHYIPVIYLFYNWKFVPLNLPHLFHSFPPPLSPLTITSLFSVYESLYAFIYSVK